MLSPRTFALIIGAVLVALGIGFLAFPANATIGSQSVRCGDGFTGVSRDASMKDAAREIVDAMYPEFARSGQQSFESKCQETIGTRRAIGWPLAGVGVLLLAGEYLVRWPSTFRPAEA